MSSKNILIFLVVLLLYINVFVPLSQENRELKRKITAIKRSIQKDKLYAKNRDEIIEDLNKSSANTSDYKRSYFFQEDNSQIFNLIQKDIKTLISENSINERSIKWGESYKSGELVEFPMFIRVFGSITNIGEFFKAIQEDKKIHIKSFIFRRTRKFYFLELNVYGLKWD